jgi:hypothetical protein
MNTPIHTAAQGYGNIYTPHAGSMIIQVQRELGLANRTIVLSARKVRMLRFFNSRNGRLVALFLIASWVGLAFQAARIPLLTARLDRLEHTTQKLDSLQTTLSGLQNRYNKLHTLLGTSASGNTTPAAPSAPAAAPAAGANAPTAPATTLEPSRPAAKHIMAPAQRLASDSIARQ